MLSSFVPESFHVSSLGSVRRTKRWAHILFASFLLLGPVVKWKTKLTIWTLFPSNACIILVMCLVHATTLSPFIPTLCIAFHPLVPCGTMSPDTHLPRIVLYSTWPLCPYPTRRPPPLFDLLGVFSRILTYALCCMPVSRSLVSELSP